MKRSKEWCCVKETIKQQLPLNLAILGACTKPPCLLSTERFRGWSDAAKTVSMHPGNMQPGHQESHRPSLWMSQLPEPAACLLIIDKVISNADAGGSCEHFEQMGEVMVA